MKDSEINSAIAQDDTQRAIDLLQAYIATNSSDDEAWYLLGRIYWKLGQHGAAVTAYRHAVEINPASPASHALDLVSDIFDFYNPDLLNP